MKEIKYLNDKLPLVIQGRYTFSKIILNYICLFDYLFISS